jgi:hypothetical protein
MQPQNALVAQGPVLLAQQRAVGGAWWGGRRAHVTHGQRAGRWTSRPAQRPPLARASPWRAPSTSSLPPSLPPSLPLPPYPPPDRLRRPHARQEVRRVGGVRAGGPSGLMAEACRRREAGEGRHRQAKWAVEGRASLPFPRHSRTPTVQAGQRDVLLRAGAPRGPRLAHHGQRAAPGRGQDGAGPVRVGRASHTHAHALSALQLTLPGWQRGPLRHGPPLLQPVPS